MGFNIGQQGWGQSTAAMQSLMRAGLGTARRATSRKRKKRSSAKSARRAGARKSASRSRSSRSSASRGAKRLVKGSAAAKAWGRKMKALRARR